MIKLKSFIVLFWIYQSALVKLVYFSNLIFIFLAFKFYKEKQCNMCIACRFLPSTSLLSCACYRIIFSPLMIKVSLDLPKTCYMGYLWWCRCIPLPPPSSPTSPEYGILCHSSPQPPSLASYLRFLALQLNYPILCF